MARVQERVTKNELMAFEYLESREYKLPTEYAIASLSSTKTQLKRKEGREFKMTRTGELLTVRVTRVK
jgi:hypothetical protein